MIAFPQDIPERINLYERRPGPQVLKLPDGVMKIDGQAYPVTEVTITWDEAGPESPEA